MVRLSALTKVALAVRTAQEEGPGGMCALRGMRAAGWESFYSDSSAASRVGSSGPQLVVYMHQQHVLKNISVDSFQGKMDLLEWQAATL